MRERTTAKKEVEKISCMKRQKRAGNTKSVSNRI